MNLTDKLSMFINEKIKEENPIVDKIVNNLARRFIIKLEKEKSKYAYNEKNLVDKRHSIYKNVSTYDVDFDKVVSELKKEKYTQILDKPQYKYMTLRKNDNEYIELYYDKNMKIDHIYFYYQKGEDSKRKF